MARASKKTKATKRTAASRTSESKVTVDRGESRKSSESSSSSKNENFLDRIQNDLEKNQSYLNLILGGLIVVVLGVLIFNYFNKPTEEAGNVTPEAQTQALDANGDVTKESLPGKYKVKEGDTLFTIAQKYYDEGSKYTEIVKDNNLKGESIEVGQELNIPKIESALAEASANPSDSASPSATTETAEASASPKASPEAIAEASPSPSPEASADSGTGGATNQTVWGEAISGNSYTVEANDWLSKISGRAYGDMFKYEIIAKANNISDPNTIEIGTVLKIPRD